MTPTQERALLEATAKGLDDDIRQAFERLIQLIRDGTAPRDAVQQVMQSFSQEYAQLLSDALSGVLAMSIGTDAAMALEIGTVQLSARLYAQSQTVAQVVQGVADRHLRGFADARALALELFEGYAFRPPDAEPLQFRPGNSKLPKYLREALLADDGIQGDMTRAFARLQVNNLRTEALRAAYTEALAALDDMQTGKGAALLEKRLKTAFYERMRYFANRIAQTEIHRAYMKREAAILLDDEEVEFVQIRRAPPSDNVCICSLFAGRDRYGLGKGVYPKRAAPVPPFHPHCLPGDALITSAVGISFVTKRWYDGDMVIITTASGKRLTATVNHPILTGRGWAGAGLLNVGDEVIARVGPIAERGYSFRDDQHQHMPARIAEIADAFFGSGEVSSRKVPVSPEDFHGDGVCSNVAVIGANRKLWDRVDSGAAQIGVNNALHVTDPAAAGLLGERILDLGLEAPGGSTDSVMGLGNPCSSLLFGRSRHAENLGVFDSPDLDPGLFEPGSDRSSADAELARQIQDGATGEVFLDQVVSVERYPFCGHVYNLETEEGHYTSNGIVTHNCRCVISPRLDLTGRKEQPADPEADRYFLRSVGQSMAQRIAGSKDKLDRVMRSGDATEVYNAGIPPAYQVRALAQVA